MSTPNPSANKQFLQNSMTQLLAYGSTTSFSGTVTQAGSILTVVTTSSGSVNVGSLIVITGFLPTMVTSAAGTNTWNVSVSQTVPTTAPAAATASPYTVQNLLNSFLEGVTESNYNLLFAAVKGSETIINNNTKFGTSSTSNLRTLITIDDGSVVIDTSKSTNLFINFTAKIKIASSTVNASNVVTVNGTSTATAALTIGSAGGNNINENHMSRPELLVALLSNTGYGFSKRFSTSINDYNVYLCQRVGLTTDEPSGFIRLSVPLKVA